MSYPLPGEISQPRDLAERLVDPEEAIVLRYALVVAADLDDAEANG